MLQTTLFTVGVPGLEATLLSWIDTDGVVLAPVDPWFIFSPPLLPSLSTEWARSYNITKKNVRWLYWLPFDPPYNVFEWYPRWNMETKRYTPLASGQGPVKLPPRSYPLWFFAARAAFIDYYRKELPEADWPEVLVEDTLL